VIVGDVMGHGPEAAAVMVQLRTAAHTLADLDLPPGEVLRRLDRMAAGMPAASFATCIYAVIDTSGNPCVIATAVEGDPGRGLDRVEVVRGEVEGGMDDRAPALLG